MIYTIENKNTKICINSLGAEVRSVVHLSKERAWQNATGEWAGCAILLFPFAGFNRLVINGEDFGVQKHGFCRNEEFSLVYIGDESIELSLRANERTRKIYPFDFIFTVKYSLTDRGYEVAYTVKNLSDRPMPFAAGGHESFALDKDVPSYYLEFSEDEKFDFLTHNSGGFLTGETSYHGVGKILSLEEDFTSHSRTAILGNIKSRSVVLKDKDTHKKIVGLTFDGFENLLLWHPHGTKMLCIEPWQCLPSYADEVKEFSEREGVITLPANGKITLKRAISY